MTFYLSRRSALAKADQPRKNSGPSIGRHSTFFAIVTLLLVGAALLLLQVSIAANGLLFFLPCYGLIALAAVIAFAALPLTSKPDPLCLCTTAVFGGYMLLRAITSPAPYVARADLYSVLAALIVYGLTVTALSNATRRIALIIALLTFAICHVLVSLIQFGIGQNFIVVSFLQTLQIGDRGRGLYENPDHLAGLLEVIGILGLSIACWSRRPSWARVIVGYLALVCYVGLALTGSRGGYLSAAASFIIFVGLSVMALQAGGASLFRRYGIVGLIVLTSALIGGGYLIKQSAKLSERVANIVDPDHTRFDLWQASIEQWKLQPLTGTGSGTYQFYGRQFRAERVQSDPVVVHNDYLQLLCEYGLVGAVAFLIFFFVHLRYGWRNFVKFGRDRLAAGSWPLSDRLALNIGALSAIGAYAVHSIVDFNLHVPANALVIAFLFGILGNPGGPPGAKIPQTNATLIPRFALGVLGAILLIQCVRLLPGEYFAEQASMSLEAEDPAGAIPLANKALIYERQNPFIYFYLGRAFRALGDDQEERSESETPNAGDLSTLNSQSSTSSKRGSGVTGREVAAIDPNRQGSKAGEQIEDSPWRRTEDGEQKKIEVRSQRSEVSGSQGANFTAGGVGREPTLRRDGDVLGREAGHNNWELGREPSANRPREAGGSVLMNHAAVRQSISGEHSGCTSRQRKTERLEDTQGNTRRSRNSYYESALAAFDKAHRLVPLDGSYPLDMAYLYDEMGRFPEAEWMYGVARSRDPRSVMMSELYQSHLEAWRDGTTGPWDH